MLWLLAHGFAGSPASFEAFLEHAHRIQRGATDGGDQNAKLIRPKAILLPGHTVGTRLGPPSDLNLDFASDFREGLDPDGAFERIVDQLEALVATLAEAPRCIHLLGYSLGARILVGLLVRKPRAVASATLVGAHFGLEDDRERVERIRQDERWARLLEQEGIDRFVEAWSAQPLFSSQARLLLSSLDRQRAIRAAQDPRGLAKAMRACSLGRMPAYWDRLGEVEVPVQLVVGELDEKFLMLARRASSLIPKAQLYVVEGAGHNVLLEAPAALAEIALTS